MNTANAVRAGIRGLYALSPYARADAWLRRREERLDADSPERRAVRERRLALSEGYIVGWLALAVLCWASAPWLPGWLAVPLLLRVLGTLNKELGVVLFGTCKITEGMAVAATGRTIVLALTNYLAAAFLFAAAYALVGDFGAPELVGAGPLPLWALVHALQVQFTLGGAFPPATTLDWLLAIGHAGFCFLFGTIVISMFVSLLNVQAIER